MPLPMRWQLRWRIERNLWMHKSEQRQEDCAGPKK